jgi:hypothetical protein
VVGAAYSLINEARQEGLHVFESVEPREELSGVDLLVPESALGNQVHVFRECRAAGGVERQESTGASECAGELALQLVIRRVWQV